MAVVMLMVVTMVMQVMMVMRVMMVIVDNDGDAGDDVGNDAADAADG